MKSGDPPVLLRRTDSRHRPESLDPGDVRTLMSHAGFSTLGVPARIPENVEKLVAPTGSVLDIAPHVRPLVKRDAHRIIGVDVLGETEAGCVLGIFRLVSAEKSVPNNKGAPMVAVDILGIGGVMKAMVSGRVKDKFEGT